MKHLKLYENINSISTIKNTMNKYNEMMEKLFPIVYKQYNKIADNPKLNYGQDYCDKYGSDSYTVTHNEKNITITEMKEFDNKIFFTVEYLEDWGVVPNRRCYVPFTEEELKQAILENETDKYNI